MIRHSLAAALLLAGCSEPRHTGTEAFWSARQAATDPLELWSVEVVPHQAGWPAVTICVDSQARAGFARPLPAIGAAQCDPLEDDAKQAGSYYTVRCDLNGRRFGVTSSVRGDLKRDFTASYSVVDLDGFMSARTRGAAELRQTRRYRKLGACPAGWTVGDATDRHGLRVRQALVGGQ